MLFLFIMCLMFTITDQLQAIAHSRLEQLIKTIEYSLTRTSTGEFVPPHTFYHGTLGLIGKGITRSVPVNK